MTKRILSVDDSRVSRMMFRHVIGELKPQWQVVDAQSAEQTLSLASEQALDVFSIDYNMPGMNGLELISELLKTHPRSKFVLLTSNTQVTVKQQAEALGACVINKPITVESMKKLVEYADD